MAKLSAAWICLDCDEVFSYGAGSIKGQCPVCGSRAVFPLWRWVRPSDGIRRAAVVGPKAALLRDAALGLCRAGWNALDRCAKRFRKQDSAKSRLGGIAGGWRRRPDEQPHKRKTTMDIYEYEAFIRRVRDLSGRLYHESLAPLDNAQRLTLLLIDAEQLADAVRYHLYKHYRQEPACD